MKARTVVVLLTLVAAACASSDETPSTLARRICDTDEMMGLLITAKCYQMVYEGAAKAHLERYTNLIAAETSSIALRTQLDAWSELGTLISAAIRNATCN